MATPHPEAKANPTDKCVHVNIESRYSQKIVFVHFKVKIYARHTPYLRAISLFYPQNNMKEDYINITSV